MIRLPYTKLRVTNTTLLPDGHILATVEDDGTLLGELTVGSHTVDIDMGPDARRRLSLFTGLCRTTYGKRPSRETVVRELVMEYRYARAISEVARSSWPQVAARLPHQRHHHPAPGGRSWTHRTRP